MSDYVLVIRAIDLETDQETVRELPAARPPLEAQQRGELTAAVARAHPDARPRSFADGVASFLGHRLLVIARYRDDTSVASSPAEAPEPVEQASLFAA